MDNTIHSKIVSFIWGIADDCLRDVYVRGKYRDVILPMVVIRRLDSVLESTKEQVLKSKEMLDKAGIVNQADALCQAAGQSFCNSSPYNLKDLTSRTQSQRLKADFVEYLDGFTDNVKEILDKFKFRNQIDTMIEAGILGPIIEKFISKDINFGPSPIYGDGNEIKLSALDNHNMGLIFEELIRKFNEENNEEAGEHFTPRDVVELMSDCIFTPIADKITDSTYSCYDGASGTGGMLTVAQDRLEELAKKHDKKVSIHLFGQEINPETYAITKADMLLKGEGAEAEHIMFGSTLSNDGFPSNKFDFMLSNPPYGKSWKTDLEKLGGKKDMTDPRFITTYDEDSEYKMIPRSSDGQLLFLLNNISKMKQFTTLGSRIAEVHNGSSLFTGDAGSGESNIRRYVIENDMLECIIALPEYMFYNTGIGTFIWILSNKKEKRRKGKVQLIDATSLKSPLRKNLGKKNCELTKEIRKQILDCYMDYKENEYCKIYDNSEFGYWKITVLQPKRFVYSITEDKLFGLPSILPKAKTWSWIDLEFNGSAMPDKIIKLRNTLSQLIDGKLYYTKAEILKVVRTAFIEYKLTNKEIDKVIYEVLSEINQDGEIYLDTNKQMVADTNLTDTEQIPFTYVGGINSFMRNEVKPFAPYAWIDDKKTLIGYELSFTKYFYKPINLRTIEEIVSDIKLLEKETDGLMKEIIGG